MSLRALQPVGFIPTNKAEAARQFYEETLGLLLVSDDGFALVFRLGQGQQMLRVVRTGPFTPAAYTIFGWEAPSLAATVDQLAAAGVVFLRFSFLEQDARAIWSAPNGSRVAWFQDPDGNTLSLSQHQSAQAATSQ